MNLLQSFDWKTAIVTFVFAFFVDGCWIKYMAAARLKRAGPCAFWAGLMLALGGVNAYIFTHSIIMLAFTVMGAMLGTYYFLKMPHE